MDFLPILFLCLFVVVAGGIAVAADDVGRKLGKKRLRFAGLRPRHTAMLGTFMLGAVIAIVTILLVAASSSSVRTWIVKGRQILVERDHALSELRGAQSQRDALVNQNKTLESSISEQRTEMRAQTGRLGTMQEKVAFLQPKVERLQDRVRLANDRIKSAQGQLKQRLAQLARYEKQLNEQRRQLQVVRDQIGIAVRDTNDTMQRNVDLMKKNGDLTTSNSKLQSAIDSTRDQIEGLKNETARLTKTRDDAQHELDTAQAKLTDLQEKLATSQTALASIEGQLQHAQLLQQMFRQIGNNARVEPLMYQRGDEVARVTVPPGQSIQAAQEALTSLLRSARVAALHRGAHASDRYPEAGLVEHSDPVTNETETPEQMERQIVQRVAGASQEMAMVATSSLNAFRGEPVSLEISVLPDPVVYKREQVVAETKIDGGLDDGVVFDHVVDFLRTKIKDQASHDHMIPRLGSDETFGEVSMGDVFSLAARVKAANRTIRVLAVAEDDTHAADPLKLEFRLR